jgi:cytoskeletal protein CcmA (bactofilin family)
MALIKRDESYTNNNTTLTPSHTHTILGPEAEFEGKLIFRGAVRIEGRFKGEIVTDDTLVIGEAAMVECHLSVGTLIVNGGFRGNVKAVNAVELHKTARFYGDILSPNLIIEQGATFEGSCKMENLGNAMDPDREARKLKSMPTAVRIAAQPLDAVES